MSGVCDRKRKMVDGEVDVHLANFKASGAELIMGSARFIAPKTLQVAIPDGGTRVLRGDKVIIGTGTHATIDPIPGLSESRGFMKALIDTKSDRILGFTAFGVGAGEIMASVQVAMIAGLPYTALRDAILTHPTLLEGLIPLFSSVPAISKAVESHE